jgi:hypothetical protein
MITDIARECRPDIRAPPKTGKKSPSIDENRRAQPACTLYGFAPLCPDKGDNQRHP